MPENSSGSRPPRPFPERFGRTVDLYGEEAFCRFRVARVAVIGLGGVGGHAALALARSGVGRLLLVDFDPVTASSLNRSAFAGPADVGRPKVEAAAAHLARTCPDTQVEIRQVFCHEDTADELLTPAPAVVADAIDSLNPKVALLAWCVRHGIPVVSSMGASSRTDFARVRRADISRTRICPLAKKVRQRLGRLGIREGIPCVYSEEPPGAALPPDLTDLSCDRGRIRNRLPSQISLPGIFGYALAALVLDLLAAPRPPAVHPGEPAAC
jgi:tRNA A37 threonylcarbamoyladenosine dehydratase